MSSIDQFCKYNMFGFCKFGDTCRKFHITNTCKSFPCHIEGCNSRHPRPCKYFVQYGRCKFNENCSYLHISSHSKIQQLENDIDLLKGEIENLKAKNLALESIVVKRAVAEEESENLDAKDYETPQTEDLKFKCDVCNYETTTQKGVNIHKGAKHKQKKSEITSTPKLIPLPSSQPQILCVRRSDGCPNIVERKLNQHTAMCENCQLLMVATQNSSPFSSSLCPCCHEPSGPYSLCSTCFGHCPRSIYRQNCNL